MSLCRKCEPGLSTSVISFAIFENDTVARLVFASHRGRRPKGTGKGERRARKAREDRAHFDFPPSLSMAYKVGFRLS